MSSCLSHGLISLSSHQPYALALALISIFSIFIVEVVALRWGTAKLARLGVEAHNPNPHSHEPEEEVTTLPYRPDGRAESINVERRSTSSRSTSGDVTVVEKEKGHPIDLGKTITKECSSSALPSPISPSRSQTSEFDLEASALSAQTQAQLSSAASAAATQLVGIAILEFGVLLHSFLIGLTLAVTDGFKLLFVVLCIHRACLAGYLPENVCSPRRSLFKKLLKASESVPGSPISSSPHRPPTKKTPSPASSRNGCRYGAQLSLG